MLYGHIPSAFEKRVEHEPPQRPVSVANTLTGNVDRDLWQILRHCCGAKSQNDYQCFFHVILPLYCIVENDIVFVVAAAEPSALL